MWNIKKELWVTVTPKVVNEDHILIVNFGHELDDATDEPKSVTSPRESQQRRRLRSAGLTMPPTAARLGASTPEADHHRLHR
jgi:hypothetical protein